MRQPFTCLDSKSDQFDMVRMAADIQNKPQSVVNWGSSVWLHVRFLLTISRDSLMPTLVLGNSVNSRLFLGLPVATLRDCNTGIQHVEQPEKILFI